MVDSDGTTIIYFNSLKGGTRLTRDLCALEKRPYVLIDAERLSVEDAVEAVRDFIDEHAIDRRVESRDDRFSHVIAQIRRCSGEAQHNRHTTTTKPMTGETEERAD